MKRVGSGRKLEVNEPQQQDNLTICIFCVVRNIFLVNTYFRIAISVVLLLVQFIVVPTDITFFSPAVFFRRSKSECVTDQ